MSGYLQYSNYGDDEPQVKRKVASTPTMQSDKNQPKRILRTNQKTLRSKPPGQLQGQVQGQGQGQGQPQQRQQHKYVQELIQKIHSYENDGDVSDSEDDDNNYVPMASTPNASSLSNPTTTIHQQFQTEPVPNRNRFSGANPDDLSAKWKPALAKEPFSLQGAKALANQYLPTVFQASSVGDDDGENKDIMLQKLDRIISLLEDQHDEKTGHVTEELVLYCFLGVFIIFIVDSFARAGKYVR
jgi:hypothetical protein